MADLVKTILNSFENCIDVSVLSPPGEEWYTSDSPSFLQVGPDSTKIHKSLSSSLLLETVKKIQTFMASSEKELDFAYLPHKPYFDLEITTQSKTKVIAHYKSSSLANQMQQFAQGVCDLDNAYWIKPKVVEKPMRTLKNKEETLIPNGKSFFEAPYRKYMHFNDFTPILETIGSYRKTATEKDKDSRFPW